MAGADRIETLNYRFATQVLRVKAGATVTFVNCAAVPHDIKPPDGSFESGNLPTLGRYFLTFDRPGEVEYFCAIHLGMRGRIIVERNEPGQFTYRCSVHPSMLGVIVVQGP